MQFESHWPSTSVAIRAIKISNLLLGRSMSLFSRMYSIIGKQINLHSRNRFKLLKVVGAAFFGRHSDSSFIRVYRILLLDIIIETSVSLMKVNIVVGKTHSHINKDVTCNGKVYKVPFPSTNHNFISILHKIEIPQQYELCLAVLSKTETSVHSIQEYYKVQDTALQYFNVPIQINSLQFALDIISSADLSFEQIDKLTFTDILCILKLGHDCVPKKMHSKLNRRINKYLSQSKRLASQIEHIRRLMSHMKNESTDEEVDRLEAGPQKKKSSRKVENEKEKGQKKRIIKQNEHQFDTQKQSEPEGQIRPKKPVKPIKKLQKKMNEDEDEDWQDVCEEEEKNQKKEKPHWKKSRGGGKVIDVDNENIIDLESDDQGSPDIHKPTKKRHHKKEKTGGKLFSYYKEKPQRDQRVTLGITGDSEEGWREKYRVKKAFNDNPVVKLMQSEVKKDPSVAISV